jgi:hypothetical protein
MPAIFHARWQAPDGRVAIALANWTTEQQAVTLAAESVSAPARVHLHGDRSESRTLAPASRRALALPPLALAIVEFDAESIG